MSTNEIMGDSDDDIEQVKTAEDDRKKINDDETVIIMKRYATLYGAAVKGDWGKAEEIYENYPHDVRAILGYSRSIQNFESDSDSDSNFGDTALHLAAAAGHNKFVEQLVSKYQKYVDLEMKNEEGNTAFCLAAMSGNTALARFLFKKNEKLAMIRNRSGKLPVQMAALLGHKEMVKFLYNTVKNQLRQEDLFKLLVILIDNHLYDVALSMVKEFPDLAVQRKHKNGETALHVLTRKPMMDNAKQGILKRFYNGPTTKRMHPEAYKLVEHLWEFVVDQRDYFQILDLVNIPFPLISTAAEQGNIDFLSILFHKHPTLIFQVNKDGYSIFHTAVLYRHGHILKLINEIPSMKDVIFASRVGEEKNNILHLTAMLPPDPNQLHAGVGAAFQMQRELLWFEGVSKLMPPTYAEAKNGNGETARTLFSEQHKGLMKEGEDWMKRTAESCMLVSTLMATVVFAAAITVPGGIKEDTGAPHFLKKAAFMIFAISDTISMVSSSCSILTFLSIFTARYAEEEFLWSLPNKLFWGVLTLFVSIIAMMVVFCATMFIIFYDGTNGPFVLAVALAPIPVFMFIIQQYHILFQVFRLRPSSNSLFQDTHTSLI